MITIVLLQELLDKVHEELPGVGDEDGGGQVRRHLTNTLEHIRQRQAAGEEGRNYHGLKIE